MNKEIRKIIKETLLEMEMAIGGGGFDSNNDIAQFHGYPSGYGEFPYLHPDLPDALPNSKEINQANHDKMKDFIRNNETYEFPFEEFKKGIDIEVENFKKNETIFNWFDVARIAIKNIESDKDYYKNESSRNT